MRKHRCIKAWFSGHFHLGQNYQNSITFPNSDEAEEDGLLPDRGSCVFCQTSVMRSGTSRDGHRQSRVLRGRPDGFEIMTVDHAHGGKVRVDARVTYTDCDNEVGTYVTQEDEEHQFEQLYTPILDDDHSEHLPEEGLVEYDDTLLLDDDVSEETATWFYLKEGGRVLGIYKGMLLEYDPSTLAPLGLVVSADELIGKRVAVIDADVYEDASSSANTGPVQAVVLIDEDDESVVVVQPNEDGSYWRKIVRNKMVRMLEMRREKAAKKFAQQFFHDEDDPDLQVVSSWGPYKQTSGTAKSTGESELLNTQSQNNAESASLEQALKRLSQTLSVVSPLERNGKVTVGSVGPTQKMP